MQLSQKLSDELGPFADEFCIVCFVLTGQRVRKHTPFKDCGAQAKVIPYYSWKDFKQLCKLPSDYSYCFSCWTPQKTYELHCHKAESFDIKKPCNLANILCLCAWTVLHTPKLLGLCMRKYKWTTMPKKEQFGPWLAEQNNSAKFNNAIDLFLYINEYHKTVTNK